MTGPATKVITTVEELKKAEAEADAIVVGYFAADTAENDTALTEFLKTARMDVNDIFYQTSVSAVAEAAGASLGSFSVISTFKVLDALFGEPEGRATRLRSPELLSTLCEECMISVRTRVRACITCHWGKTGKTHMRFAHHNYRVE